MQSIPSATNEYNRYASNNNFSGRQASTPSPAQSIPMQKIPSNVNTEAPNKSKKKGLCEKCQESCLIL